MEENIENLREEDCLYYVVEENEDFVYLQNTNVDVIFKETELPEEIKQNIMEGYILRYKNGTYEIDEEETSKYEESLVDVKEYIQIKQEFIETSGILENSKETRYKVLEHNEEEDFSILEYEDEGTKEIKVPNALLPYFLNDKKILFYEDGKFKTDSEATKKNIKNER